MPRARHLIAASLVVLMAGSAAWFYVGETQHARRHAECGANRTADSRTTRSIADRQGHDRSDPHVPACVTPMAPPPPSGLAPRQKDWPTRALAQTPGRSSKLRLVAPPRVVATLAPAEQAVPPAEPVGRDRFTGAAENAFRIVREAPVSTFSIDVDTASYSFVRASLNRNVLPQPHAVRVEELINYFPYAYPAPTSASEPFRTTVAVFPSPWSEGRKIVQIGIKGYAVQAATRPRANLVFLIDTSGSMNAPNRLPLVKQSLAMLLTQLAPDDRVAIVTYAGHAGTALEPTAASDKSEDSRACSSGSTRTAAPPGPRASGRPMRWPSRISIRTASTG